jgi:multidrug resistance efflux pump
LIFCVGAPRSVGIQLKAAHDLLNGHESTSIDEKNQAEIYNWLDSHHLLSPELSRAQKTVVDVLAEHYTKLLQADGDSYDDLIEAAYTSRHDFQDFIHQIHTAEKEVDRAILTLVGDNQKLKEKLQLEEQQVAERRNRILETNY